MNFTGGICEKLSDASSHSIEWLYASNGFRAFFACFIVVDPIGPMDCTQTRSASLISSLIFCLSNLAGW